MSNGRRLYREVMEKMLDLIDSGVYPAGGRLPPERELAERFKVSRPTVREAIIALEALERVSVKTGSGVYVLEHPELGGSAYQNISPFELTEARALIEGEAAALAAKMITPGELEQVRQSLEDMAKESETGDLADGDADPAAHGDPTAPTDGDGDARRRDDPGRVGLALRRLGRGSAAAGRAGWQRPASARPPGRGLRRGQGQVRLAHRRHV